MEKAPSPEPGPSNCPDTEDNAKMEQEAGDGDESQKQSSVAVVSGTYTKECNSILLGAVCQDEDNGIPPPAIPELPEPENSPKHKSKDSEQCNDAKDYMEAGPSRIPKKSKKSKKKKHHKNEHKDKKSKKTKLDNSGSQKSKMNEVTETSEKNLINEKAETTKKFESVEQEMKALFQEKDGKDIEIDDERPSCSKAKDLANEKHKQKGTKGKGKKLKEQVEQVTSSSSIIVEGDYSEERQDGEERQAKTAGKED